MLRRRTVPECSEDTRYSRGGASHTGLHLVAESFEAEDLKDEQAQFRDVVLHSMAALASVYQVASVACREVDVMLQTLKGNHLPATSFVSPPSSSPPPATKKREGSTDISRPC